MFCLLHNVPQGHVEQGLAAQGGCTRLLGILLPCDIFFLKGLGDLLFRNKYLAIGYLLSLKLFGV